MTGADVGLAVLHVATGAFFATTGARKLFLPSVRAGVRGLLASHGVPAPAQWAVMAGEFAGGLGLLTGCLTQAAAAGLLVIMAGAYRLDTWPAVMERQRGKPASVSRVVSNALCTPEAQLIVILAALLFTGAGGLSLDALR